MYCSCCAACISAHSLTHCLISARPTRNSARQIPGSSLPSLFTILCVLTFLPPPHLAGTGHGKQRRRNCRHQISENFSAPDPNKNNIPSDKPRFSSPPSSVLFNGCRKEWIPRVLCFHPRSWVLAYFFFRPFPSMLFFFCYARFLPLFPLFLWGRCLIGRRQGRTGAAAKKKTHTHTKV